MVGFLSSSFDSYSTAILSRLPITDNQPPITNDQSQFMIQLSNVSKVVTSGSEQLTILHSLDLEIQRGQFVSVIGPSGSGKSTLLGLIAGLDAPTTGSIKLDGHDITQMSEDELAELRGGLLGFIFQSFHLLEDYSALDNVLMPARIARRDISPKAQPTSMAFPCWSASGLPIAFISTRSCFQVAKSNASRLRVPCAMIPISF